MSAELNAEVDSMLLETGAWDWGLLPPLALGATSGWVGWEIGSAVWGVFFEEAAPSSEGTTIFDDRWTITRPGELLLSSNSSGAIYAPSWGLKGSNHFFSGIGRITDSKECEIEVYGDGERLYLPEWTYSPGCWFTEFRNYVLWKPFAPVKCGAVVECGEVKTIPYKGGGQVEAPTAEQLRAQVEAELQTTDYPVLNSFLNHEIEPENYPDPRDTEEDEDHRCDRAPGPTYMNPGGNESPEPFAKQEESAFTVTSRPEGYESVPVYLRAGTTHWIPGKEGFEGAAFLDDWGGWGYRHIVAKHGWSALDRVETELALTTDLSPKIQENGNVRYEALEIANGVGGVECTRVVIVDFDAGKDDPSPRGIVTSFNKVSP